MLLALVLLPLLGALATLPAWSGRAWMVPLFAFGQLGLALLTVGHAAPPGPWLGLDAAGSLVLLQVCLGFAIGSLYVPTYLQRWPERDTRVFCGALLVLLAMMCLSTLARHLGLMWVALETATLAAAPLIPFHNSPSSIEATWKYLLVGSVGVALALLGSFFLAYGALYAGLEPTLHLDALLAQAPQLSRPWLHAALVFLFVGYGTKVGLAPMHAWKPDAYGEAPGLVGALMAGGLTSCAVLALLRCLHLAHAAGEGDFARELLLGAGLLSMAVAAVFVVRQRDLKRLLAYSSVEHVGVIALGAGLGGPGLFAALYHMLANGFTKGALFLAAANLHRAYGNKRTDRIRGALARAPHSAVGLLIGFFAISGAPPFAPFMSELSLLRAGLDGGRWGVVAAFLSMALVIFVGSGSIVLELFSGTPPDDGPAEAERPGLWIPIVGFLAVSLLLGLWLPPPLRALLVAATAQLEAP